MDPQTNLYLRYYTAQSGGELSAFHGSRRGQTGDGLGDILRGIWRTIFPIAARGASTFLTETIRAKEAGGDWRDAAKAALAPAAHSVLSDGLSAAGVGRQSGSGRRRHHRKRRRAPAAPVQTGGRRGYKRPAPHKVKDRRHPSKRIKFLNF